MVSLALAPLGAGLNIYIKRENEDAGAFMQLRALMRTTVFDVGPLRSILIKVHNASGLSHTADRR